jgi:hypothetical protein
MKRAPFDVRFVLRNLTRGGAKTWILLFSSGIAAMLLLMLFSIQPYLKNLLRTEAIETYGSIDLVVTYDANSSRRILNQRKLSTDYQSIGEWSTFFNTMAYAQDRTVQLFGGPNGGMRFLTGSSKFPIDGDEAFITATLAREWNIGIGERITIHLQGIPYEYQVVGIEPDRGLFSEEAVFVDKTALLSKLLQIENLGNLGNTIYVRLTDVDRIDDWIATLKADSEYADFDFIKVIDPATFHRIANYTTSILLGILLLGVIAVFVVIRSVVPLYHREFRYQIGVVKTLGANPGWVEKRWAIQFLILGISALPIGWGMLVLILEFGRKAYGIHSAIAFPIGRLFLGSLVFLILFQFLAWLETRRFSALSAMDASRDRRAFSSSRRPMAIGLMIVLLVANALIVPFPEGWSSAVTFLLGIGIVLEAYPVVFGLLRHVPIRSRASYFRLVSIPWLASSKPLHGAIRVAFVTMLVLASSASIVHFVSTEADVIGAQVQADYLLANVFDYNTAMKADLLTYEGVETVGEAILFERASMSFGSKEKTYRFHLSMRMDDWLNAFEFSISGAMMDRLEDVTGLYAAVPMSIARSMGIRVGDTIVLDSGSLLGPLEYQVAGVLDINYDNLILTNLIAHTDSRHVQSVNAIFLSGTPSPTLFDAIASDYGARMYAMIPMKGLVDSLKAPIVGATRFIVAVSGAFALAFCIVLWNNARMVFHQFKSDYARYWVLGSSKRELIGHVAVEFLAMSLLLALSAVFSIQVILPAANGTMLLFGFYKEIPYPFWSSFLSSSMGMILFWLSFGSIAWGIARLKPIQEIKQA